MKSKKSTKNPKTNSQKSFSQSRHSEASKYREQSSYAEQIESEQQQTPLPYDEEKAAMEEAIQKASCLVELLHRENTELRLQVDELKEDKENFEIEIGQLTEKHEKQIDKLIIEMEGLKRVNQNQEIHGKVQKKQKNLQSGRQETQQRNPAFLSNGGNTITNQRLHEKISHLVAKNAELTQQIEALETQNRSVESENQYLLDQMRILKTEEQQKQIQRKAQEAQVLMDIQNTQTTKNAFARRTQELHIKCNYLYAQMEKVKEERDVFYRKYTEGLDYIDSLKESKADVAWVQEKVSQIHLKLKNRPNAAHHDKAVSVKEAIEQIEDFVKKNLIQTRAQSGKSGFLRKVSCHTSQV